MALASARMSAGPRMIKYDAASMGELANQLSYGAHGHARIVDAVERTQPDEFRLRI